MLRGLRGQDRLAAPHRLRGLIGDKLNVLLLSSSCLSDSGRRDSSEPSRQFGRPGLAPPAACKKSGGGPALKTENCTVPCNVCLLLIPSVTVRDVILIAVLIANACAGQDCISVIVVTRAGYRLE